MAQKLTKLKRDYYYYLDRKSRHIAYNLSKGKKVTKILLDYIKELYDSEKVSASFENERFESAYHNPITSEFEFLIARLLYHYSNFKKSENLDWKIYLRRQIGKTAPDIRIEKDATTLAIIEVKAKVGWMQGLFSDYRREYDRTRLKKGKTDYNIDEIIKEEKARIKKLCDTFEIPAKNIFYLLPSLKEAHRKKYKEGVNYYKNIFKRNFGLPKGNLILLSNNLQLDLDSDVPRKNYQPTNEFEEFIHLLSALSK